MLAQLEGIRNQRDPQTYAIIGAAMEVHKRLGRGFLEQVYHEALAVELGLLKVPFEREVDLAIIYRGEKLKCHYRADFVCYGEVLIEIKAIDQISKIEEAQVLNYIKATAYSRALLINFCSSRLEYKRDIMTLGCL